MNRPRAAPGLTKPRKMLRPGWPELVVASQTVLPALLFIPQLSPLRTYTRVAAFIVPLMAWAACAAKGLRVPGGRTYPPVPFLIFGLTWVAGSAFLNPGVNTLASALAAAGITAGVLAPALWAPGTIRDTQQIGRVMMVFLACSGASALMGMGQVYRPDTFRPPRLPSLEREGVNEANFEIELSDGRRVLRPPGLTDIPGGAAMGGQAAFAIGLALALMPVPWWKRGMGGGLALVGLMILFYSQVRVMLLTLVAGLAVWIIILALRREARKLAMLAVVGGVITVVGVSWVVATGGEGVMRRYLNLFERDIATTYYMNRGAFIENMMNEVLPSYPLGAGPGRAGMAQTHFGDPLAAAGRERLYAETQIEMWILDGGFPLLIAYALALAAAVISAARTALTCPDQDVAYWAGVVLIYAVASIAASFGGHVFMSQGGVQFWCLLGALFGTDCLARDKAARRLGLGDPP